MKEHFVDHNFRGEAAELIERCESIVEDYDSQGLKLTLRQLYYQLVSANAVPNTERSYKRVGSVLSDARLAGLIDWDAIEDRVRQPWSPNDWEDINDIVDAAISQFKMNRRRGQEDYVELWVEKDALAGVLQPLARKFHCTLMVNRGYSSTSAMYESAKRFRDAFEDNEQTLYIGYIGDHDPSGLDMDRDIHARLSTFNVDVIVERIALTTAQVRKNKLPPNPAKFTDSRAASYVAEHGKSSWEVDALPPRELQRIATAFLEAHTDQEMFQNVIEEESEQRKKVRKKLGLAKPAEDDDDD